MGRGGSGEEGVFIAVGLVVPVHVRVHSCRKRRETRCRCSLSNTEQLNFNRCVWKSLCSCCTGFPNMRNLSAALLAS